MCVSKKLSKIVFSKVLLASIVLFVCAASFATAGELIVDSYNSDEARRKLLEFNAEGRLNNDGVQIVIYQKNNGKYFRITSKKSDNERIITLVPRVNNDYVFPHKGSWQIIFDKNEDIESVLYYIQNDDEHFVRIHPYQDSIEVSLMVDGVYIFRDIIVPISLRNFFKMPIQQFFRETRELLYWDWVFPSTEFIEINEKSRNLSSYLASKLQEFKETRLNNLYEGINFNLNEMEKSQVLSDRRATETRFIQKNIDAILQYIGSSLVDPSIFDPYDVEKRPYAAYNEDYLRIYTQNVVDFLKNFPDFYTSVDAIDTPLSDESNFSLASLYIHLYFMTAKFPGLWYLVPIVQIKEIDDQQIRTTITMEVLIPYYNLEGEFNIYGFDNLKQYLDEERDNQVGNTFYEYDTLGILRVPNKRVKLRIE